MIDDVLILLTLDTKTWRWTISAQYLYPRHEEGNWERIEVSRGKGESIIKFLEWLTHGMMGGRTE